MSSVHTVPARCPNIPLPLQPLSDLYSSILALLQQQLAQLCINRTIACYAESIQLQTCTNCCCSCCL
jgi:hypothetical protein